MVNLDYTNADCKIQVLEPSLALEGYGAPVFYSSAWAVKVTFSEDGAQDSFYLTDVASMNVDTSTLTKRSGEVVKIRLEVIHNLIKVLDKTYEIK